MKRLLSWIAGILLLLLALAGMAVFFLTTEPGERIIRKEGEKLLTESLGRPISIGTFETNLFSRIKLEDVTIREDSTLSAATLLSLDKVEVHFRLFDLLYRTIHIDEIRLDSLRVDLRRDSTGRFLIAPPVTEIDTTSKQSTDEGSGLKLRLGQVTLIGGSAWYEDELIPLTGSVDGVDVTVLQQEPLLWSFGIKIASVVGQYQEWPIEVQSLMSKGQFTPDRLQLDTITFVAPGFDISGEGGFGWGDQPAPLRATILLTGTPEPLTTRLQEMLTSAVAPMKGMVTMTVQLDGSLTSPRVAGIMEYQRLELPSAVLENGRFSAIFQRKTLQIRSFQTDYQEGQIALSGSLRFDSLLTHALDVQLDNVNLGKAWSSLYHKEAPYRGVVRGGFISNGPLLRPRKMSVQGNLAMEQVRYKSQLLPDFTAIFSSQQGIANLNIKQANSTVDLKLMFARRVLEGEFAVRISELGPLVNLANISDLDGRLAFSGKIKGTFEEPVIEANFDGSNLVYQHFPVDSLRGSVSYDKGRIRFGESMAMAEPTTIDTTAPPFNLKGIEGTYSYELSLHGSPENPSGSIQATFSEPVYAGYRLDAVHIQASIEDTVVQVERLQVARDSLLVRVSGEYDLPVRKGFAEIALFEIPDKLLDSSDLLDRLPSPSKNPPSRFTPGGTASIWFELSDLKNFVVAVDAKEIRIENLRSLVGGLPDIAGEVSFESSFAGSPKKPEGELRFTVISPRYQTVELDSMRGDIQLSPDLLNLRNFEIFLSGNRTWASLTLGLQQNEDGFPRFGRESTVKGRSEASKLDLLLANTFLKSKMIQGGSTSYNLAVDGSLGRPLLRGNLEIDEGRFRIGPDSPEVSGLTLNVELRDTVLTIDSLSGKIGEVGFDMTGKLSHREWQHFRTQFVLNAEGREVMSGEGTFTTENLDLKMTTRGLNLSMLQAFTPGVKRLQGLFRSSLAIHGPTSGPDIDGTILIRGLTVQLTDMDKAFTQGTVKLSFDQKRVQLDSLAFTLDQGNFFAHGELSHANGTINQIDMTATGKKLRLKRPGLYLFTLERGAITLQSKGDRFALEGDLYLGETAYYRRMQTSSIIDMVKASDRTGPELPDILKRTDLNVRIRESEDVWVDNNLARFRTKLDLVFLGSVDKIKMNGRATVEEGYVLFLDRKFRIENGVLDFIDPNRINPLVELTAVTELKAYQTVDRNPYIITLTIQGPVDEARVTLTSDPPLSESDIFSMLTVGATREQIAGSGGSGTTMTDILRQRAEDLSSQRISGYVSRRVGSAFGLEEMSVEGNLFNVSDSWGPQLLASKRLTDRMAITYTTRVGHMNEQGIKLDYMLSKYFSVEGQTDQQGQTGLDLIYKLRFK